MTTAKPCSAILVISLRASLWQALVAALHLKEIAYAMRNSVLLLGALFIIIYIFEAWAGADKTRYLSRNFLNDLKYAFFYRGGIYVFFIYVPIVSAIRSRLPVQILPPMPLPLTVALYILVQDFFVYWVHRLQHASSFLWEFHRVHHSQTRLTFVTESRFHLVDQLQYHVLIYIPLTLLFGIGPSIWVPIFLLTEFLIGLDHAELSWRLGRFYPVLVSPIFHSVHHSIDTAHLNKNFGMLFSFWDFIFGTAIDTRERPKVYGVDGWNIPESFIHQSLAPFRVLYHSWVEKVGRRYRRLV